MRSELGWGYGGVWSRSLRWGTKLSEVALVEDNRLLRRNGWYWEAHWIRYLIIVARTHPVMGTLDFGLVVVALAT